MADIFVFQNALENCAEQLKLKENNIIEPTKGELIKSVMKRKAKLAAAYVLQNGGKIALIAGVGVAAAVAGKYFLVPKALGGVAEAIQSLLPVIEVPKGPLVIGAIKEKIAEYALFRESLTAAKIAGTAMGGFITKSITAVCGVGGLALGSKVIKPSDYKYQKKTEALRGFKENDLDRQQVYENRVRQNIRPLVKALKEHPEIIQMRDSSGNSILDYAIELKDTRLIKKLKKMGADFDTPNAQGLKPRLRLKKILQNRRLAKRILPAENTAKAKYIPNIQNILLHNKEKLHNKFTQIKDKLRRHKEQPETKVNLALTNGHEYSATLNAYQKNDYTDNR